MIDVMMTSTGAMKYVLCRWSICVVLLLLLLVVRTTAVDMWWHLGMSGADVWRSGGHQQLYVLGSRSVTPACLRTGGLSPRQTKFCQLYPDHMASVGRGARMAIAECQWQFRNRRWNCSTVNDNSVFGPVIDRASREASFTHAVSAAGVVSAVARACRDGELSTCGCSRRRRPSRLRRDWVWGGCGDNTDYGYRFAVGFVDAREKEKNYPRHSDELSRMLMNLHNNEAGRRAVYRYAKVGCKCHGVSGSCSVRTCWNQLPSFRETGDRLRDRYDAATQVMFNGQGTRLIQRNRAFNRPTRDDLVFIEPSRSFCDADAELGSAGTRGRQCNRKSAGTDGCDLMCCGRGYTTTRQLVAERCRCKFHWCCRVECELCQRTVELNTCK